MYNVQMISLLLPMIYNFVFRSQPGAKKRVLGHGNDTQRYRKRLRFLFVFAILKVPFDMLIVLMDVWFIFHDTGPYGSWFTYNLEFWTKHRGAKNFLFLKYEDMKQV